MGRKSNAGPKKPLSLEEKLGHVWGFLFVGMVVVLTLTIVGKACFFVD